MKGNRNRDLIIVALVFTGRDPAGSREFVRAELLDESPQPAFLVEPDIPDSFLDLLQDVQCDRFSLDVELLIGPDGEVEDAELPVSSGLTEMDASVRSAALESRFLPLRWRGLPVRTRHTITYCFEFGPPPTAPGPWGGAARAH